MRKIGVLALQGDYEKHAQMLSAMGEHPVFIRSHEDLSDIEGLIIPGGESTTIGRLLVSFDLMQPLVDRISSGMPTFGTCAGLIVLARKVDEKNQFRMGLLDIDVVRNGYGRQIESFEADVSVSMLGGEAIKAVFIRAPIIETVGDGVSVLAVYENAPILVQQEQILASTFHPELTGDTRIHEHFLQMIGAADGRQLDRLRA